MDGARAKSGACGSRSEEKGQHEIEIGMLGLVDEGAGDE